MIKWKVIFGLIFLGIFPIAASSSEWICDCSIKEGVCTGIVEKVDVNETVENMFSHQLTLRSSTEKCSSVVIRQKNGTLWGTETIIGGKDVGLWSTSFPRKYSKSDLIIESCDICKTNNSNDVLSELDHLIDNQIQIVENSDPYLPEGGSQDDSFVEYYSEKNRLDKGNDLRRQQQSAHNSLNRTLATVNMINSAKNGGQIYSGAGIAYGGSGETNLVQECRSKTAHITSQMNSIKQEYGTITKEDAIKVIRHNELGVQAANICLQIFPAGSEEYHLTLQTRNTYQAGIAHAKQQYQSLPSTGQTSSTRAQTSRRSCGPAIDGASGC